MFDEMFCMTNDVVTALQLFLKEFFWLGINKDSWVNVSEASSQAKAVSERISDVDQLPIEVPTYVLQVLTKFSFPEFTGKFELILNQ